jgi:hypothetical protein
MAQAFDGPGENKYERLNEIARGRPSGKFYDEDSVSPEEFEQVCKDIIEELKSLIDDFAEGTTYTKRQAQARVLGDKVALPTPLTNNAIGVLIGWMENKDTPIDEGAIRKVRNDAEKKSEAAYETAYVETATQQLRQSLDHESLVWLDYKTKQNLIDRREDGDQFVKDIVQRLLTETREVAPLRELLENIVEEYNVADIQMSKDLLHTEPEIATKSDPQKIHFNVSGPWSGDAEQELADVVEPNTVYEVAGHYFQVQLIPCHSPGGMLNSVQLYAEDNIQRMESVSIDEGLDRLRAVLEESDQ